MKPFLILLFFFPFIYFSQDIKLDPQKIAADNFKSVVKILLFDSIAEKKKAGKGYYGRGSGFIVSEDGLIFTNKHVVESSLGLTNYTFYDGEEEEYVTRKRNYSPKQFSYDLHEIHYISKLTIIIQVYEQQHLNSYQLYRAKVVSIDTSNYDVAILKIVSKLDGSAVTETFKPVKIGNSDLTYQGEELCFIGFPKQYEGTFESMLNDQSTLLEGRHAGFDFNASKDIGYLKTDVIINSGNSGGPVFNAKGEVIGLASAASSVTNNGFIAKINGMYHLCTNDYALLKLMVSKGLTKPNISINTSGVLNNPNYLIPNIRRINKYNEDKKNERLFLGGFFYAKASFGLYNNNSYIIKNSTNPAIISNPDSVLKVKNNRLIQYELGKSFSFSPFATDSKFGVDWSIINVGFLESDWSNSALFTDTLNSKITFNAKQTQAIFATKLGIMYSELLFKRNLLNIYYKAGISQVFTSKTRASKDQIGNFVPSSAPININQTQLLHTFGIDYHFDKLIIGFEYVVGKSLSNRYSWRNNGEYYELSGSTNIQNFNVSLGFPLYNNRKWKKYF
jgi:hypothetical protein